MDWQKLLSAIAPVAVGIGAGVSGHPQQGASFIEGFRGSDQLMWQRRIQEEEAARRQAALEAETANRQADNVRQDHQARLQRLSMALQQMGPQVQQQTETATDPMAAQQALGDTSQQLESTFDLQPGAMRPFVPQAQALQPMMSQAKIRRAKAKYSEFLKLYGDKAGDAESSLTFHEGEFAGMTAAQVRQLAEMTQPPPTSKKTGAHLLQVPGPDGGPMTKSFTDEQVAAGVPTYQRPTTPAGTNVNPVADPAQEDQAQQLVDGNLVPGMLSKRSSSYNNILALANQKSKEQTGQPINFLKLETQYRAAQQFARSQNGSQATRFRSLGKSVINTINEVRDLADELKQGNVQLFNRARRGTILQVYGGTPQSDVAARYVAAVNTLKEEFAGLIQGGYAPTESAFHLANQQINEDYGVKDLSSAVTEVQRLINYRLNAFEDLGPLLPGQKPEEQTPTNVLPPGVTVTRLP